ncbi:collagenase-like [Chironomus tepperi]|uniref:collagenase-like n=1 Tax=Chironomus tepperi TaxID=113505 RepID=UPI00391FBD70
MRFLFILLCAIFGVTLGYKYNHKSLTVINDDSVFEDAEEDRNSRLINSNNATDGQFPFSARFSLSRTDGRVTRCSGSIISSNFVLSAGHCIDSRYEEVTAIRIDVGTSNIDVHRTTVNGVDVWWLDASELAALDLAIYRLENHLTFNSLIAPVRLPRRYHTNFEFVGFPSQIIGWGTDNTGSSARILQYGNYLILSNQVCGDRFTTFFEMCSVAND